jgi:hypothetical protein
VRSYLDPTKQAAYDAARRFVEVALRTNGSLFLPDRSVWSSPTLEDLHTRFNLAPDESTASFEDKLARQLNGAPAATIQLAAEIVYVHFLIARDIGAQAKRRLVELILSWSPEPVTIPEDLQSAFETGVCNTGVAFKTYRPRQLWFLIDTFRAWKELPTDRQSGLLADPWGFKDWVESIPQTSAYTQRQGLLHLLFPEEFEDMVSRDHKALIIAALGSESSQPLPADVDRALALIRERLTPEYGASFSFYDPGLRERWQPGIEVTSTSKDSVSELLEAILVNLQGAIGSDGQQIPEQTDARRDLVQSRLPVALRRWVAPPRAVKGSNGQGNAAAVPWVLVGDKTGNDSAQVGFYLVYLFAADGSRVYLSLNQGTAGTTPGLISTRALQMRRAVGPQSNLLTVIDLASSVGTPAKYERGNALAVAYETGGLPDDAELLEDLERMLDLLTTVEDSGLAFETDPLLHVLLK